MMHKQCLMLRSHTQTSLPPAGPDEGMPCTTSSRVPVTKRGESCPSPFLCHSYTSTQEAGMEMTLRTARARPSQLRGRQSRGTANLPQTLVSGQDVAWIPTAVVWQPSLQSGQVAGG